MKPYITICNRFFPTTKQIIDDSIFSVADYCWVYLGVRMFCIRVVIIMLSSVLAWMYAVIERVIANHNMWPIFSTDILLRVQSYFRLSLLHRHLKVVRAMDIWTQSIGGYIQECTVLCFKALRFIMYTLDISRSFFLETTYENNHKGHPTLVENWMSFWGSNYFNHIFVRVILNTALNWTAKYQVNSSTVLPSMLYFHWMWTSLSLFFSSR